MLIKALWGELELTRDALQRAEMDHELLRKALTDEIAGLRDLATERDFVIDQQAAQLDAVMMQTVPKEDAGNLDSETLMRELQVLRQRLEERDTTVRRLRADLAEAEEQASASIARVNSELDAVIRVRQAELDRARERVAFLRGLVLENLDSKPVETVDETPKTDTTNSADFVTKHDETVFEHSRIATDGLDVSRYQANADLQREVEQSLAFQSLWPVLAVTGTAVALGVLGFAAAVFLLG
jgi:predicted RNase H-like nuclease (RuvC/YqgF family)